MLIMVADMEMHDVQPVDEGEWLSSAQAAAMLPATTGPAGKKVLDE